MAAVTLSLRLLTASLSSRGKSATAAITSAVTAGRSTGSALLRGSKGCGRLITSRPALSLHASAIICTAAGDGVMEVQLKVGGMVCDGCSSRVEEMLQTMAGVKKAHVDLEKGVATVQVDADSQIDALKALEPLAEAIKALGFDAEPHFDP